MDDSMITIHSDFAANWVTQRRPIFNKVVDKPSYMTQEAFEKYANYWRLRGHIMASSVGSTQFKTLDNYHITPAPVMSTNVYHPTLAEVLCREEIESKQHQV